MGMVIIWGLLGNVMMITMVSLGLLGRVIIWGLLDRVWVWPWHLVRVGGDVRSRLLAMVGFFSTYRVVSWGLLGKVGVFARVRVVSMICW